LKNKLNRSPRVRSPKVEKPVDEIQEVQENKEVEDEDKEKEKQDAIEEIEYVSDKSLEDEEADVERDALTVATTALESTYNETNDQKSPEEDNTKLE